MNIALFGYGKMGKKLEQIGQQRGHRIGAIFELNEKKNPELLRNIDIAIDFSTPDAAFDNLKFCFENGVSVVCGTTGWVNQLSEAEQLCRNSKVGFIYASNFSLGVNLFFDLNQKLAKLMASQHGYHPEIEEIHHTQKLDAPSGTAITLAEGIIANTDLEHWHLTPDMGKGLPITALREGQTPGTHRVSYQSMVDRIDIIHTAHTRDGFALGAMVAAEWLTGKKGVFNMKDVLNLQ